MMIKTSISEIKNKNRQADLFVKREWKKFNEMQNCDYKKDRYILIAKFGKEIIGFAGFKITGGSAYLSQLIVKDSFRNKGVGNLLIKRFEKIAKDKNCHEAYLETSEKHKEAIKFYKNQRYKIATKLKNHKFHLTWYIFVKKLK